MVPPPTRSLLAVDEFYTNGFPPGEKGFKKHTIIAINFTTVEFQS